MLKGGASPLFLSMRKSFTQSLAGSLAALFLMACCQTALADNAAAGERSEFEFSNWSGKPIKVRLFVPDEVTENTPIVFVMHGASRAAESYFNDWLPHAEQYNYVIVVPEFTVGDFPKSDHYNLGHVFSRGSHKLRPEADWTFSAIEPLFDDVVERIGGQQTAYTLYGHSAGSQFVYRFLYYKPNARVNRYIAANAGWYTLPDFEFEYPYGLKEANIDPAMLAGFFAKDLILLLGREDTDPNADKLRQTKEARNQGSNRLARGMTMYRTAREKAEELGVEFNWRLILVPGADHDNAKMAPAAAALVMTNLDTS